MNQGFRIQDSRYRIKKEKYRASCILYLAAYLLFTVYCLLLSSSAYAHKVNIFAYAENDMVHTEGYFVDGTKCKNSTVEVFDEQSGIKLLEGKTDNEGRFSFKIPEAVSMKIVLHASMGHQAEYIIKEEEIKGTVEQRQKIKKTIQTSQAIGLNTSDLSEIEAIVERVTDKKLQTIMNILLKIKEDSERPGITEILGGIGYIIGIMGIIMYFKGRAALRDLKSNRK
jgi:nickel transport protein